MSYICGLGTDGLLILVNKLREVARVIPRLESARF